MIKQFTSLSGPVPYATLEDLATYSQEQIAKFGEATFDDVVQLTILREKIYQESALMAASTEIVNTRRMDRLEAQIFAPGDTAVQVTYPVPPESIAPTERKEPVSYNIKKVDLDMAEVRYFLTNDAKLRGAYDWLQQDSARRAIEHLAETKDEHIMTEIIAAADSNNTVTATATWDSPSATPEDDVAKAISNIIKNSNIKTSQINKNPAFAVVIPAESFVGVTKLKLIRNITQPIRDFLGTEYGVKIILSRKPRYKTSWPISTQALVIPVNDSSIGFLATFDGGGIIPAQEIVSNSRGQDHIIREWYKWIGIPEPLDGSNTDNARIAIINGLAS